MTRSRTSTLAGAAVLIGAITLASRVTGFVRLLVFARTVGSGCLGDAYTTANQLPNVVFELLAGGMLAATVVPLVAGAAERGDRAHLRAVAGGLLGWLLLLLGPATVLAAALAGPYAELMLGHRPGCAAATLHVTRLFLVFFAPQIVLYGLSVWASALLAAHRRFGAAAAAPLVSTLVVMASYIGFALSEGRAAARPAGDADSVLSAAGLAVLAGGTTLGVLALAATVLVPLHGLSLRLRPRLRFPAGVGRLAWRLSLAGVAGLASQQVAMTAFTWLANHEGVRGTNVLFSYAFAVFVVPFAVLLAPLATSVFPQLSAAAEHGRADETARLLQLTLRVAVLGATAGAAVLAGAGVPTAALFTPAGVNTQVGPRAALAAALVAVAPGLLGYGMLSLGTRVLAAQRRSRAIAAANTVGWLGGVVAAAALIPATGADRVVVAIGGGLTIGLTVGGVAALVLVHTGPAALPTAGLAGVVRPLLAGAVAAVIAAGVGRLVPAPVSGLVPGMADGLVSALLATAVTGLAVLAMFAVVVTLADRPDARVLAARLRAVVSTSRGRA